MKKLISIILCCTLVLALAGCAGTTVVVGNCTCPPESHNDETVTQAPQSAGLKTGLAIVAGMGKSVSAAAEADGKADFDVTIVAVTVDADGIIRNCVIDSVGVSAAFKATGEASEPGTQTVKTKNEKGFDYGMSKAENSIGKEWFEQADALAQFAVGKTVEQVKGGYGSNVDLATSATMYLGGYVGAMEVAAANAKELGADSGDDLKLAVTASLIAENGKIQLNLDVAALTLDGKMITSAVIDSLQAKVEFDTAGVITSDLTAKTKNELGYDYGMGKASKVGKEWFEQAAYFCDYITGKTLADVATIAVNEDTKTTEADLATGCTIAIGGFQGLIAKIAD